MITYVLSPNQSMFLVDLSKPAGPVFNSFEWFDSFGWFSYTIGTFALMARFIRSFTLRATSRNWKFHYLDPFYWMNRLMISNRGGSGCAHDDSQVSAPGELGTDPPKRFFNAFTTKKSINRASARSSLFLRNSVSSRSPSQVGMY